MLGRKGVQYSRPQSVETEKNYTVPRSSTPLMAGARRVAHAKESPMFREAHDGRRELLTAKAWCRWPDGTPFGHGHPSPCLQMEFACAILDRRKLWEGRPGGGWVEHVTVDDWVNFQVAGGKRLVCRVRQVRNYSSFDVMVQDLGIGALLPCAYQYCILYVFTRVSLG